MYTALVIRPGETEFDREERIQGSLDLPLTAHGRAQVQRIIEQLREHRPDVLLTSPSEPARSTAEMISEALGIPLRELDGLCNMDQGLWQGMLLCDLRRKHPRVYRQWEDSPESVCPPAGETCDEAAGRVERALRKPMRKGGTFAVVASEPLASLVSSVLHGDAVLTPGSPTGRERAGTVEVIDPSRTVPETAVASTFDSTDLIGF
jgi:probable phosphoglycerate mutase